jgi:hypothetical protein
MPKVTFDISVSLDGFIRAADPTPAEPLGVGGEQLHTWAFGEDERDREVLAAGGGGPARSSRAVAPTTTPSRSGEPTDPPARRGFRSSSSPTPPAESPPDGVYRFAAHGVEAALTAAQDAAGDEGVTVMGGADVGRQFLAAGLVDELSIHLVPVLFGRGTRLFEGRVGDGIELEPLSAVQTPNATHLRFRVVRP